MSETPLNYEVMPREVDKTTLDDETSVHFHEGSPHLKSLDEVRALDDANGAATGYEAKAITAEQQLGRLGALLEAYRRDAVSQDDVELTA